MSKFTKTFSNGMVFEVALKCVTTELTIDGDVIGPVPTPDHLAKPIKKGAVEIHCVIMGKFAFTKAEGAAIQAIIDEAFKAEMAAAKAADSEYKGYKAHYNKVKGAMNLNGGTF